jgi:hypothetical protein
MARIYAISRDCAARQVLGEEVSIEVDAFDEMNITISRRSHCWAHSVFNQTDIRAPCLILKVTFKNTQRWRINNGPIGQSVIV